MALDRKAANGETCVRCGAEDGTIVLAHYQGDMAHVLGKGLAVKSHDLAGAWLCNRCHNTLDGREPSLFEPLERSLELAIYSLKTLIIRIERGDFRSG